MKKIKLLLAALLSLTAWNGAMAQDTSDADYLAAKDAITDGGTYRIKTNVNGTDYYVTSGGGLTNVKDNAGFFTITKTSGGYFGTGFRIDSGTDRFTNPPLSNDKANLTPGNYSHSTGDRTDWERQILYKNDEGKYAIRSCNCADGTSSWNDAARTHWTWSVDPVVAPCYTYDKAYVWEFDGPLTTINVTYKLVESDGTTEVSSTTKKQEANSALISPLPGTGMDFNGFFHEKFYFDYTTSGTIGDTDCTITITRTPKAGVVNALSELSNTKAYYIGCDRGAMIAYNGSMVNTALNDATANAKPLGKFALLNYEDNYYIFSVDENKFIKNDASVALDLTTVGFSTDDAIKIDPKTAPYFLLYFNIAGVNYGLNTNGNAPLGYVIDTWMTADQGNQYYMVEAADFDPTAALAELEAYFHPSYFVTYVVKDELGNTIFTSEPQPTKLGATITTLLDEFKRPYYTYNDVDVTISEQETTAEFTATWTGPFEISADFASAHWYNMAVRGNWYVTSGNKDGDGALKTVEANAVGLVEDAYQWAFVGNTYAGFKLFNKAEGDSKVYAWTSNDNASIPAFVDAASANVWSIKPSTSSISNAFMLTTDKGFQTNQFGGAGGSLKIWNSTGTGDAGSAFTVFDVPTNFASFLVDEGIAAAYEAAYEPTGYFALTDAAKTALGWDPAYKTDCPFETYKSLKENQAALSDINNFNLPETGYYLLKNKNYGTYLGIDPSDANLYGNYATASAVKQIVYLKKGTGDNAGKYSISLEGKYAPATVAQSAQVTAGTKEAFYTVSVPTVGYAAFTADPSNNMSVLHCAGGGNIVGWEAAAAASQWKVEAASSVDITLHQVGEEYYATLCVPFAYTLEGAKAYKLTLNETDNTKLDLAEVTTVPAGTPVFLQGTSESATVTIAGTDFAAAPIEPSNDNVLTGTYTEIVVSEGSSDYFLGKKDLDYLDDGKDHVGFYHWSGTLGANRAYIIAPVGDGEVKGFTINFGGAVGIRGINQVFNSQAIYDLGGRKVQGAAQRGIYVVGGKKMVIK